MLLSGLSFFAGALLIGGSRKLAHFHGIRSRTARRVVRVAPVPVTVPGSDNAGRPGTCATSLSPLVCRA
jgi:hypothetical protein